MDRNRNIMYNSYIGKLLCTLFTIHSPIEAVLSRESYRGRSCYSIGDCLRRISNINKGMINFTRISELPPEDEVTPAHMIPMQQNSIGDGAVSATVGKLKDFMDSDYNSRFVRHIEGTTLPDGSIVIDAVANDGDNLGSVNVPLAADNVAGLMPQESYRALEQAIVDIAALQGVETMIAVNDDLPDGMDLNDLNSLWTSNSSIWPVPARGTLVSTTTSNTYTWFMEQGIWLWSQSSQKIATNSTLGSVMGTSGTYGKIFVENDGTMSLLGYNDILDQIDDNRPTIAVGDVTTVPFTYGAAVSNSGTDLDAVFDFQIPAGEQGIPGQIPGIGIGNVVPVTYGGQPWVALNPSSTITYASLDFGLVTGEQGETGPTPQLGIGTVNTTQPGTSPTVTITGPANAPLLNFTMPDSKSLTSADGSVIVNETNSAYDISIQPAIDNLDQTISYHAGLISDNAQAIQDEYNRAIGVEANLNSALAVEIVRAKAAELALSGRLDDVETDTQNLDFAPIWQMGFTTNASSGTVTAESRNIKTAALTDVSVTVPAANSTNAGLMSAANAQQLAANTSNIAANASDIATNASNIAANASNIAANTSNIAANSSNIAANASNIGALQSAINKSVVSDVSIASTATTMTLSEVKQNISTGATATTSNAVPVASSTGAGIITNATFNQIQTNASDIASLQSLVTAGGRQVVASGLGTSPTQQQLTAAFNGVYPGAINAGDRVFNTDDGDLFVMNNAQTWVQVTGEAIPMAGASAGLAISNATAGNVSFANGVGTVNGWAAKVGTSQTINGTAYGTGNITISAAPAGTAGGDLSGTYPNPALAAKTRTNTTSTASPGSAGTFTAIDSVTTNAAGQVTGANTKTVTMPTVPAGVTQYAKLDTNAGANSITGTNIGVTGTLPIGSGGTGAATASAALTNLGAAAASALSGYLPLAGGTMTGKITTPTAAAGTPQTFIGGAMGGTNDHWGIAGGGAADAGYLELWTDDNGNEAIYARQYSGVWSSSATPARTATLLGTDGSTAFPVQVTSPKFIMTGAAATDVLMGNGTKTAQASITANLASNTAANALTSNIGVTGTLPVGNGGTGLTSAPSMLTNLATATAASPFASAPRPGVTGLLPDANIASAATWNAKQAALGNSTSVLVSSNTLVNAASASGSDIARTQNSNIYAIANNAVTYGKFQQVAANSVLMNNTGAAANVQAVAVSTLAGLVKPANATASATGLVQLGGDINGTMRNASNTDTASSAAAPLVSQISAPIITTLAALNSVATFTAGKTTIHRINITDIIPGVNTASQQILGTLMTTRRGESSNNYCTQVLIVDYQAAAASKIFFRTSSNVTPITNKFIQIAGTMTANTMPLAYATAADAKVDIAANGTANRVLRTGTANTTPTWSQVALGTDVSGTLPVANGGTGQTALTGANSLIAALFPNAKTTSLGSADYMMMYGSGYLNGGAQLGLTTWRNFVSNDNSLDSVTI